MQTVFRGVNVVAEDVRREMRTFDAEYLDPNNYESWLESSNYKYAVEHKG